MQKLLVANWKENPQTESEALKLFRAIAKVRRRGGIGGSNTDIIICPPFIYLEAIAAAFRKLPAQPSRGRMSVHAKKNLALGAQDVFWEEHGAFTGEVGPKMLCLLGAHYVIIGHSERRKYASETDEIINRKIKLALKDGLRVILCVGEPRAVRKKGLASAEKYIKNQLKKDLAGIAKPARGSRNLIIAYEPIWAIGSGKNDKPEDAVAMARVVKQIVHGQFLYGGSANSKNIADYVQYKEIDGALVGGASLKAAEFTKMIAIVSGRNRQRQQLIINKN
jgi:triosephosphate isomerase (TIM)